MCPLLAEYLDELKQYGPTYTQWAGSEEDLLEPLKGVAGCVERCSKETEEQIQHLSEVLVPALHEYVLCAETLKVSPDCAAHISTAEGALAGPWSRKQILTTPFLFLCLTESFLISIIL